MYRLSYSALLLLASIISSQARHTVFVSRNGEHTYLPSSSEPGVCMKRQCVIAASNVLTSLDETVDPCEDFFKFACGGWLKRYEITEDKPVVHVTYEMQHNLNRKLRDLLESEYKSSDPPFVKKLKDFYNTCTDLDSIEKRGSEPLKEMLIRLGGWPVIEGDKWDETTFDWVDSVITLRRHGYKYNRLIRINLERPDNENETFNKIILHEPHTTLPYQSNITLGLSDDKISEYLKEMVQAAKMLDADESTAEKELEEVMHFLIAVKKINEEETGETEIRNLSVKELQEEVPQVPWLKYLNALINSAVYENDTVKIYHIDSFTKAVNLINSTKKRVIANYLIYYAVLESTEFLSKEWRDMNPERNQLDESKKKEPRWQFCLSKLMGGMQYAISSFYIRHYFNAESKDEAKILMKYIYKEFLKILEENDWMDEKTREKAEEKAHALKSYIGYPEEMLNDTFMVKTYENLTISTDNYLVNIMTFKKLSEDERFRIQFRKKMGIFPRDIKFEAISKVAAYYDPFSNSIGIPAGILHDAYFEKDRPNYMNFGAIGYVIGHEITHGFDNEGRLFDKNGNRANWWDKESDENFRKKVQCLIDQYDNYTIDGLKVNGKKTLDENIADNAGLKEAYWAYQTWTKDNGIEPLLPALNYTQNQLFWFSAAHVWCSKMDPVKLQEQILRDNHSPGRYRIIGPMSNLEEFSKDFKCSADSPMNRKYKCKVW